MDENRVIIKSYESAKKRGVPCALATIVHINGSSYRRPGAKMLITGDGEISGSVSGGCLERDLIRRALMALKNFDRKIITYDTSRDADDDDQEALIQSAGLGCEGVIEILIEPNPEKTLAVMAQVLTAKKKIVLPVSLPDGRDFYDVIQPEIPFFIFGAGHDAIAMTDLAYQIGWEVTLVDCRSSFAIPKRFFTKASHIIQCEPEQISSAVDMKSDGAAIVMTHNYLHDKEILKSLGRSSFRYMGVIGPRVRTEKLLAELKTEGLDLIDTLRSKLSFPAGLDLGGEGPDAIALSVISEAQALINERHGGFLKNKPGSIHHDLSPARDLDPKFL